MERPEVVVYLQSTSIYVYGNQLKNTCSIFPINTNCVDYITGLGHLEAMGVLST